MANGTGGFLPPDASELLKECSSRYKVLATYLQELRIKIALYEDNGFLRSHQGSGKMKLNQMKLRNRSLHLPVAKQEKRSKQRRRIRGMPIQNFLQATY